jgi:hypothetical protein
LNITAHGREINQVFMVGYDTDKCVVDKPCGAVTLSTSLAGKAEVPPSPSLPLNANCEPF